MINFKTLESVNGEGRRLQASFTEFVNKLGTEKYDEESSESFFTVSTSADPFECEVEWLSGRFVIRLDCMPKLTSTDGDDFMALTDPTITAFVIEHDDSGQAVRRKLRSLQIDRHGEVQTTRGTSEFSISLLYCPVGVFLELVGYPMSRSCIG